MRDCFCLRLIFPSDLTLPHGVSLRAICLRQATVGVISGQEAVLQVNHCLTNLLVAGQEIVVVDRDFQVLVLGQVTRHLKHPKQNQKSFGEVRRSNTVPIYIIYVD